MASTCVTGFLVVLFVLQPWIALSYLLPPVFPPVFDDVCKEVVCGKGTCKPSNQSAFFLFECECDPGWKQANFGLAENFKLLPCVVPDCTINYSCKNASSPVQDKGSRANESIFDPCYWTNCGGDSCNKSSNFTYSCECAKDYYNILNDTSLPCFQDCAIGTDCLTLKISSSNKSTSGTPACSDDGENHDDVCKGVVCGKGTCKPSNQSAFFLFECECDPGWKQANFGLAENFKFLPCVVPNCTINYSCMNASSPVQDKGSRANESIFDPCHWTNCGGGFCNKTSNFTYSCECAKDYYNILDDTSLPCFLDCAIGMDCSNLGISSSNKSTSATQALSDDGMNHATSILQGHFLWLITLMTFMAMVQWK
ncbi:uncharacterized protein LOC126689503 isoform X5 [Quercus robur]|uniref:uncharacterized protein LOC126689503 isoform X5 n=1 Tax=Quercus robur TaxID=38942 RepID=UPI002163A9B6|nr:uncharacterized protein LOC126689503 isoform X5 [Quercus robur]